MGQWTKCLSCVNKGRKCQMELCTHDNDQCDKYKKIKKQITISAGWDNEMIENFMVNCKNKCPLKASRHNDDYTLGLCDGLEQGKEIEQERIIKILENNWLRGTVARRVIDEIIEEIKH